MSSDINERLWYAARDGEKDQLQMCIKQGADVNFVPPQHYLGWTPLHVAARCGHDKICRILLDAGAEIDKTDKDGGTPLHEASENGQDNICRILLDAGAQIDKTDNDGETPLHLACHSYGEYDREWYYKLIMTLIHEGADISVKNKVGKVPFDYIGFFQKRKIEREYEKYSLHKRLMSSGSRPVDVMKVFLCGDPSAGKTTLKNTLTKKLSFMLFLKGLFPGSKKDEQTEEYLRTPGIDVERKAVKGVGQFLIWDCAGQVEYAITHGMFLGSAQSIFLVVYNVLEYMNGNMSTSKFWLPFVKATKKSEEKPKIVLVATHADEVKERIETGVEAARKLLKVSKKMFSSYLDIDDEVLLVDARDENSADMEKLKNCLKRQRKDIVGKEKLPKLCDDMKRKIKPWRNEAVPVISWNEFLARLKKSYTGIDEETLRAVTAYLHIMGDVYWGEFTGKDDQIILNPQWFTKEIIGKIFAGSQFGKQQTLLHPQPFYTLAELRSFFTDQMETSQLLDLLSHMDLVHEAGNDRFLIPGKLPEHTEDVSWDACDAFDVKGISIECAQEVDIFNPSIFPCVQKKILDERQEECVVSRTAVKSRSGSVTVFVQLAKHKEAINIAVMCRNKKSMRAAYRNLQGTIELIETELSEKSAGTNLRRSYISHADLRKSKTLEDVRSFTEESIEEAERNVGLLSKGPACDPEDTTDVVFQGYDDTVLKKMGPKSRIDWLPADSVRRCFGRLDVINDWREDYRSVARLLGIADHERDQIVQGSDNQQQSRTVNLIKEWCEKTEKKMTIGMLRSLLSHLSLEDNADALKTIDKVIDKYPGRGLTMDDCDYTPITLGIPDHLVRWRRVLKRKRDIILSDMDPSLLTGRLYQILPLPMCTLFENVETSNVKERMNNAKTLVLFLLEREEGEWPRDLLTALRETDQSPLAQALQAEYDSIVKEKEHMKEQRRTHQRDLSRMEYKTEDAAKPETKSEDYATLPARLSEEDAAKPSIKGKDDVSLTAALSGEMVGATASNVASGSNVDMEISMSDLISQFQDFTGCSNPEEASRCLRNADMDIQRAVNNYFEH